MTDFFGGNALANLRDHLLPGLWPLLAAFVVCALTVPLMIRLARRIGVIAMPSERHAHSKPTPALGGLAMFLGFAAAVLFLVPINTTVIGLIVASGLATVLLVIDDRSPVRPLVKLAMQVAVAVVAVVVFGDVLKDDKFVISFFGLPGGHVVQLGLLATPVSIFWLLGMQNTVNFLDGADGLAAGVIFIVAVTLMLAAAGLRGQTQVVQLAGALAGTCAGFLVFNWHPAKIFMGDSGSHFLGLALALLSIIGVAKVAVGFALAVPVIALAVPIADTAWAIIRRRRAGLSIAHADSRHIHHHLLDFGLTQPQTCFLFYGATALLGSIGLMLLGHQRIWIVMIVLVAVGLSTVAGDRLQDVTRRVPVPGFRRLFPVPHGE